MKQRYSLSAQKRILIGKKVKQLRTQRLVPAHVFGHTESVNLTLDQKAFLSLLRKAGETSLIELTIEGEPKTRPVLIAQVTYHPVSGSLIHVDLQQVNLTEKVTAHVPVEMVGESEAVKAGGVLI